MVEKLGMTLKKLRKENNLKQREIADAICVSIQAYSRYENNICEPSLQILIALADYYKISIDELLR